MQVSIKTLISLIVVRSDPLTRAAFAALGDNFERADYALTQADANAIIKHLETEHAENDRTLPAQWLAETVGKTPSDMQFEAATEINQAVSYAMDLIRIAGLDAPYEPVN
jgi:hypothetical protein